MRYTGCENDSCTGVILKCFKILPCKKSMKFIVLFPLSIVCVLISCIFDIKILLN